MARLRPDEIRDTSEAPWPAIPAPTLAGRGDWRGGKGMEVLLDALALLVEREEAGHSVELVILGDGRARGSFEEHAAALGIGDWIHWFGPVAGRQTCMDALASCDLFVFPSATEGFPKVILDAMAVGLPVVATARGELSDLMRAGIVGGLGALDGTAVAYAIVQLTAEQAGRRRMVEGARRSCAAIYTLPNCALWWSDGRPGGRTSMGPGRVRLAEAAIAPEAPNTTGMTTSLPRRPALIRTHGVARRVS